MKKKRILVIEDNELNMKLVRSLLQLSDYDVIEAVESKGEGKRCTFRFTIPIQV